MATQLWTGLPPIRVRWSLWLMSSSSSCLRRDRTCLIRALTMTTKPTTMTSWWNEEGCGNFAGARETPCGSWEGENGAQSTLATTAAMTTVPPCWNGAPHGSSGAVNGRRLATSRGTGNSGKANDRRTLQHHTMHTAKFKGIVYHKVICIIFWWNSPYTFRFSYSMLSLTLADGSASIVAWIIVHKWLILFTNFVWHQINIFFIK